MIFAIIVYLDYFFIDMDYIVMMMDKLSVVLHIEEQTEKRTAESIYQFNEKKFNCIITLSFYGDCKVTSFFW
jgi:hypothetical protein